MAIKSKGKSKQEVPLSSSNIPISFSFRFYDETTKDYCISEWNKDKIALSLKRLKEVNEKTYNEMIRDKRTLHFHEVIWSETKKPSGFPNQANQLPSFQFELLGVNNGKARVYGALSNNIFHIVWFDFNHGIWPTFKKHT